MRKVLFILSELADSDVDWFVDHGIREVHAEGTVLIQEGKRIPVLYVVLDGQLSVTLAALGGKEVALLRSGEILGELSFLDSRPPAATVTVRSQATVLSISRDRLSQKLAEDLGFASRFYRALGVFLSSRLRKTQLRLGYGDGDDHILDEDVEHEDELDPELLDTVALAGARFDWMLKRLRSAPATTERAGDP